MVNLEKGCKGKNLASCFHIGLIKQEKAQTVSESNSSLAKQVRGLSFFSSRGLIFLFSLFLFS
jgi:hypothetical protein